MPYGCRNNFVPSSPETHCVLLPQKLLFCIVILSVVDTQTNIQKQITWFHAIVTAAVVTTLCSSRTSVIIIGGALLDARSSAGYCRTTPLLYWLLYLIVCKQIIDVLICYKRTAFKHLICSSTVLVRNDGNTSSTQHRNAISIF